MKVLFVADPLDQLNTSTDTSLYLLRECFQSQMDCYWANPSQVSWHREGVRVNAQLVLNSGDRKILPQAGAAKSKAILDFGWIFIRKEPPVDASFLRMCWLLAPYEDRLRFSNPPSLLIRHHEKMLPLEALARGFVGQEDILDTCVTDSVNEALEFAKSLNGEHLILKPWLGHGGRDVRLLDRESFLQDPRPHLETGERWMIQAFEESIFESGDRRVFFIGGKYVGDFVRIPKSGHFVSNLVRGGKAVLKEMSEKEKKLTDSLGAFLKALKIDFAGADYIASCLSEVNITSPTGLGSFEDLGGRNLASDIVSYLKESRGSRG